MRSWKGPYDCSRWTILDNIALTNRVVQAAFGASYPNSRIWIDAARKRGLPNIGLYFGHAALRACLFLTPLRMP
jgi:hypothetical protein